MSEQDTLTQAGAVATDPAAPPSPPPSSPPDAREYIILESKQAGVWHEKEKVKAGDNNEALAAISDPDKTAKYQVIASRNWSPKSPEIETVTTVNWK